jgi:DNA-directed RNA polymerase sigma subunit (sigma70/sigma32)
MEMLMTTADEIRKQAQALQELARKLRKEEMQRMRKEGLKLWQIAEKYELSKERVRQILDEKDD